MDKKLSKGTKEQIRNVLIIITTSLLSAGLLAGYMIFQYGPSGRYTLGNTLLAPAIMNEIKYDEPHPQTGKQTQFVFSNTEFIYYDKVDNKRNSVKVNLEQYEKFYNEIATLKSVQVSDEIKNLFHQAQAMLIVTMRTDPSLAQQTTKIFQLIQFMENDYFRVQLRGLTGEDEWAYFYHPQIYKNLLSLFVNP